MHAFDHIIRFDCCRKERTLKIISLAMGVLSLVLSSPGLSYAAPDLIITMVSNPSASVVVGSRLSITDTVRNRGSSTAEASSKVGYWLKDVEDGSLWKLPQHREVPALAATARSTGTTAVQVPVSIPAGTYLLRACADVFGKITESHEGNNCLVTSETIAVSLPTLTVTIVGPGSGIVISDLIGIDCGVNCSEAYPYGTSVTLTATPDSDSVFAGWVAPWIAGCSRVEGHGTCTVTMEADRHITAFFGPVLTVTTVGPGNGTVTLNPPGITCASDCSEWYPADMVVTLSASPKVGSNFTGWSGSCTGPSPTCTVVLDKERAVTAFFGPGSLHGSLDLSFGHGGRVTTNFYFGPDGTPSFDPLYALVLQSDGKIVAGGETGDEIFGDLHDFALARYNPNGTLDPSFGIGGKVTTDFKDNGFDLLYALALQPDGKLIGGGRTTPPGGSQGGNFDFALARYNSDGSLDPTFGNKGKVTTDFETQDDAIRALAIQPDGKIIAVGRAMVSGSTDFALVRYNPDGSLDPTFGNNGKVTTAFGTGYERGLTIVLQPDGKAVVAGSVYVDTPRVISPDFGLVRYNSDGSLDTSFGNGGKAITDFGGFDQVRALLMQPDGKIVAAGSAGVPGSVDLNFGLARYNPDGSLDPTFGDNGKVSTDFGSLERAYALLLQPDGKIVAAGASTFRGREVSALARYDPDGTLDASFGNDGRLMTDFGTNSQIRALLFHHDAGKILAGGISSKDFVDFSLERYHP
jgi:uncharacterized delta-60 repeat protein